MAASSSPDKLGECAVGSDEDGQRPTDAEIDYSPQSPGTSLALSGGGYSNINVLPDIFKTLRNGHNIVAGRSTDEAAAIQRMRLLRGAALHWQPYTGYYNFSSDEATPWSSPTLGSPTLGC